MRLVHIIRSKHACTSYLQSEGYLPLRPILILFFLDLFHTNLHPVARKHYIFLLHSLSALIQHFIFISVDLFTQVSIVFSNEKLPVKHVVTWRLETAAHQLTKYW